MTKLPELGSLSFRNTMLYAEPWNKFVESYRKATKDKFYISACIVIVLFLSELLLAIFATENVVAYTGNDIFFKIMKLVFKGTLPFSMVLIFYYGYILFAELQGIKTWYDKKGGGDKKKYKPNKFYPFIILLESFFYASIIYSLLPLITYYILWAVFQEVEIPQPIAGNEVVSSFVSNPMQDLALALGGGFYDEFLYRYGLTFLFIQVLPKQLNNFKAPSLVGLSIMTAFIYSALHFVPYWGDTLILYSFFHRFFFGIILYNVYHKAGLTVAILTHVFYDIWYFMLA